VLAKGTTTATTTAIVTMNHSNLWELTRHIAEEETKKFPTHSNRPLYLKDRHLRGRLNHPESPRNRLLYFFVLMGQE